MNVGMLWLDTDKRRSFEEKVRRAVEYYCAKYGQSPNLCLVNNRMLTQEMQVDGITVRPVKNVVLHHFWLGREN